MVDRRNMRMNMRSVRQSTPPSCNGQQNLRLESNGGSCNNRSDCKALMHRLQKIDFSIVDTVLYLDMYPECKKALEFYHKLLKERDELRAVLAERCKRPMSSFENASDTSWDWISSPWPWDASAN